jgi:hypothetical protein
LVSKSWLAALLVLAAIAGCTAAQQQTPQSGAEATVALKYLDASGAVFFEKSFSVPTGTNALEAMQQNVPMETETFSFGVMVKSVNGVAPPEGYYLALYMNGAYAEKGIQDYSIDRDTEIEWRTEKIESAPVNG